MQFKEATDILFEAPDSADLASSVGETVRRSESRETVEAISRARLDPSREPPNGWEEAIAKLAMERCKALAMLVNELGGEEDLERLIHDIRNA